MPRQRVNAPPHPSTAVQDYDGEHPRLIPVDRRTRVSRLGPSAYPGEEACLRTPTCHVLLAGRTSRLGAKTRATAHLSVTRTGSAPRSGHSNSARAAGSSTCLLRARSGTALARVGPLRRRPGRGPRTPRTAWCAVRASAHRRRALADVQRTAVGTTAHPDRSRRLPAKGRTTPTTSR